MRSLRDIADRLTEWVVSTWHGLKNRRQPFGRGAPTKTAPTTFRRLSDVDSSESAAGRLKVMSASSEPAPELPFDAPVYAIGDVHGRADLLKGLMKVIESDENTGEEKPHIVFLGDYIDRGFQSRDVIEMLIDLADDQQYETVFLKGNHEQAMLHFLSDHNIGPEWANFGGRETLISYNVAPPKSVEAAEEWHPIQKQLQRTIPKSHVEFLEQLVVSHKIGPYAFVHAGVRPGIPYEEQSDEDLMWIRDEFLSANGKEDLFIVHGHTPVDSPYLDHRRVNVDTGAYFTGRLTAVKIFQGRMSFLNNKTSP